VPAASFGIRLKGADAVTVTEQEGAVTSAHATLVDGFEIDRQSTVRVAVAGDGTAATKHLGRVTLYWS